MSPLPSICRTGKTALEKKLLLYYHLRKTQKYELRYKDSTLLSYSHLPKLKGKAGFVPLYEISQRVFTFEKKSDKMRTKRYFKTVDTQPRSKKRERRRKKNTGRSRKKSR